MNPRRTFVHYLLRALYALLFIASAVYVIAVANGYQFNWQTLSFESTGVIYLTVQQTPATLTVNGKSRLIDDSAINLTYLTSGWYKISLSKSGYTTWNKTFSVQPGRAIINLGVELFRTDLSAKPATDAQIATATAWTFPTYDDLTVNVDEIWAKQFARTYPFPVASSDFTLISRTSSSVYSAEWFPGKFQILYQAGNHIYVMDRDGSNVVKVVTLSSDAAVNYYTEQGGKILIYADNGQVWQKVIQ